MCIGENIYNLRKALKLTQENFAARLTISKGFLSNLEKNVRQPSDQLIKLIAYEYSSSEDYLKTGQGEMFIPPDQAIEEAIEKIEKNVPHISGTAIKSALRKTFDEHGLLTNDFLIDTHLNVVQVKTGDPELDRMIGFLIKLWSLGDEKFKAWASVQFDRAFPKDVVEEVEKKSAGDKSQAEAG